MFKRIWTWVKLQWKKLLIALGIIGIAVAAPLAAPTDDISLENIQTKYAVATEIKAKYVLNEATLVKTDIKNPKLDLYKNEPKDEVKVTIGDNAPVTKVGLFGAGETKEFKPDIQLSRWNEVSFKLKTDKLLKDTATKDKTLSFEGDKIKYGAGKMSFEMFDYAEGEGGYKYIWYLNEKPATNKVEFEIETSGLDFFYQPPLNEEENPEADSCTETQCFKDGQVIAERPENIVGSYAVYHSTKGGMNDTYGKDYKAGKAFHIYRPHLFDANGLEAWGNLHIENGIYSVEIPQDFLDKAVYPIKSNDTFGYTTLGSGTTFAQTIDRTLARIANPGQNGTVTDVRFGAKYASGTQRFIGGLYLDSNKSLLSPQGNTITINSTTMQFWTSTIASGPSISNQNYDIAVKIDGNSGNYYWAYDNVDDDASLVEAQFGSGLTWENPWSGYALDTIIYSIYATYTPSGGGAAAVDANTKFKSGHIKILDDVKIK